ncbi:hypothetical protein E2C01_076409 [Portunus trituberculatus]|uniref:Uncharacterized protein n=1 Tax=Portunus trituberculatus TaxID=210409 RepID=A0A5B7IHQ6_PORTR|nr:hypothetical protein [Portunus trituberculatus]
MGTKHTSSESLFPLPVPSWPSLTSLLPASPSPASRHVTWPGNKARQVSLNKVIVLISSALRYSETFCLLSHCHCSPRGPIEDTRVF